MRTRYLVMIGIAAVIALPIGLTMLGTFSSIATAPGRVIQETLKTDNIINNYEWFHDAFGQYKTKVGTIENLEALVVASADDRPEIRRLNIELVAIRSGCRDLANQYNANSTKSNVGIFRGKEAPEKLSAEKCG